MEPDLKWRSVFGTIERGKKFTVFSLSVRLKNGLLITSRIHWSNNELAAYPSSYKYVLDGMVKELDKRIAERV